MTIDYIKCSKSRLTCAISGLVIQNHICPKLENWVFTHLMKISLETVYTICSVQARDISIISIVACDSFTIFIAFHICKNCKSKHGCAPRFCRYVHLFGTLRNFGAKCLYHFIYQRASKLDVTACMPHVTYATCVYVAVTVRNGSLL